MSNSLKNAKSEGTANPVERSIEFRCPFRHWFIPIGVFLEISTPLLPLVEGKIFFAYSSLIGVTDINRFDSFIRFSKAKDIGTVKDFIG